MKRKAVVAFCAALVASSVDAQVIDGMKLYRSERAELCLQLLEYRPLSAGGATWQSEQLRRIGCTTDMHQSDIDAAADRRRGVAFRKPKTQEEARKEVEDGLAELTARRARTASGAE